LLHCFWISPLMPDAGCVLFGILHLLNYQI
jgi:hypothetical protein